MRLLYFIGRGVGSSYYILLVGVCVQLTRGLLPLPCRYSETITVGEWVASIIFYWGCVCG